MSIDARKRFEALKPILDRRRTMGVAPAGAQERTRESVRDRDQDELSWGEEGTKVDNLGEERRNEKVALVLAAMAAGTYSVSARAIASKMLDAIFSPSAKVKIAAPSRGTDQSTDPEKIIIEAFKRQKN